MLLCALAAAAAMAVLHAMGRPLWCSCGSLVPWAWSVWSQHNSQHVVDPYTFTHVLHGLGFYALLRLWPGRSTTVGTRLVLSAMLEALWEILENTDAVIRKYRTATMSLDYFGDSVINAGVDIAACLGGFLLAARLPPAIVIGLFVLVELTLVVTVRDSLMINIVMLLCPIEAVRVWQVAGAPGN